MSDKNGPKDVAYYGHEQFVAPGIGTEPPVGARIAMEIVCRVCMTAAEEISMRRGFIDPVSAEEARESEYSCARCGETMHIAS